MTQAKFHFRSYESEFNTTANFLFAHSYVMHKRRNFKHGVTVKQTRRSGREFSHVNCERSFSIVNLAFLMEFTSSSTQFDLV